MKMIFIEKDKYKNYCGIYCIFNILTGDAYVGQTKMRFEKRYWHHCWKLRNNTHDNRHLQKAWNDYGEEFFNFYILKLSDDPDVLDEYEIKYIDYFKKLGNSYNIQSGGHKGYSGVAVSEENKKRIAECNRIHNLGRKASEETKKKMSEVRKGKANITKNTILTTEIAFQIKTMLVNGEKASDIAKKLNINYKLVNGIMSNNTWSHVKVIGWDEYLNNRKTYHRLTPEDHKEIYRLFSVEGLSKEEIAEKYHRTSEMIRKIIKKYSE